MTSNFTFALARVSMRAPRVAIVIPGGEHWDYWVRLALYASSRCWGGQGFVVVPHDDGSVDPALLQAIRIYDPDYVVRLGATVGHLEEVEPGSITFQIDDGPLDDDARSRLLAQVRNDILDDETTELAREAVTEACTPYRQSLTGRHDPSESTFLLTVTEETPGIPSIDDLHGLDEGPMLSCPTEWAGPLAVAAASRSGFRQPPTQGQEPGLDDGAKRDLARWLLELPGGRPPFDMVWHPAATTSVNPGDLPSAFDRTRHRLDRVRRGVQIQPPTVAFIGDSPTDFALSLIWDRLYGRSIWLPSALWPSDATGPDAMQAALASVTRRATRSGSMHWTSTSLDEPALTKLLGGWSLPAPTRAKGRKDAPPSPLLTCPTLTVEGSCTLAVTEQFDRKISVAVETDRWGGRSLMTPPPPAVPDAATFEGPLPSSWEVDLELDDSTTPRMRGIDGADLLAEGEPTYEAWVRSGRDGISYHSHRYGLVLAGSSFESQMARPRVRDLGLHDWIQAKASQTGYHARLSAAGNRLALLSGLWGSQDDLSADVSGPLRQVLIAFAPAKRRTDEAYPIPEHGVVLGPREGFLSFAGIEALVGEALAPQELREKIDWLAERGILRRGLVLGCAECERPAFISVDRLGQANDCPRCGSTYQLSSARWQQPLREPIWFYDLHWAMRQQLEQNGDVPLILADHLRRLESRSYADLPEFEFTLTDSGATTEIDLIAHRSGILALAEAKSVDKLGRNADKTYRQRVRLSRALRADELILATTASEWSKASVERVRDAIDREEWPAGTRPSLRVIANLGTDEPVDVLA